MPPKKAKTKAKANAVVKTSTRSNGPAAPATVVTNRGNEYDTTAAATRPRRATASTADAPTKTDAKTTVTSAAVAKKRGRSAHPTDETVEPPKKRGRPAKAAAAKEKEKQAVETPKKRGRPAKSTAATSQPVNRKPGRPVKATATAPDPPKKRGRPAQVRPEPADEENDTTGAEPPKKRGRPAKKHASPAPQTTTTPLAKKRGRPSKATTELVEDDPDTPAPRKRHSGRTGGPTTKISTDAADAADQLEEELVDETTKSAKKGGRSKPSSNAMKQDDNKGGKNYWLMKAEQVDRMETLKDGSEFNTKFTIDDLKGKRVPEPWEGVRNMVARNNMRAMKQGDLAFFYASQGKFPGITGIIEVVQEHEPDFTVTDEHSIGYVEPNKRGSDNQWSLVHVEYRKKLSEPVTLKQLQKFATGNGILKDMQVIKQSRLSVAKVSEKEWDFIVNNLIEGYEEEAINDHDGNNRDDDDGVADVKVGGDPPNPTLNDGHTVAGDPLNPTLNDDHTVVGGYKGEPEALLPDLPVIPAANSTEGPDEVLTSGTALPPTTLATSRPTSRQASRPMSRAGSEMLVSIDDLRPTLEPTALQVAETFREIVMTEADLRYSVKPSASSRASSRAPSRASSRAPAPQSLVRGSSLEPPARPGSRGRSKTPNMGTMPLMPSLLESPVDA